MARFAERTTCAGLAWYAVFAPHSIAGSWIGLSFAILGWLLRTFTLRRTRITRTALDLPLWLFFAWTVLSALLSAEPRVSVPKLASASIFLIYYLAQSTLTRRWIVLLASLMIASGVAGALWSILEVTRGRGVIIEEIAAPSPLRRTVPLLQAGDTIWRVGADRVSSVAEIDEALRRAPVGTWMPLHVIARGEHVVWEGTLITQELKNAASPSGLKGQASTHRFRASGWTRHYETFAEMLLMLALFALGAVLANFQRKVARWRVWLPAAASLLLATGIALTAMRTALIALAIGAGVIAWRGAPPGKHAKILLSLALVLILALGALVVWQTRAGGALRLQDASAALRWRVARAALQRIPAHPFFGHGMDAVKSHWTEWGFPGDQKVHTHSTWLQLAFDRGIPALLCWLWIIAVGWRMATRAERIWRTSPNQAGTHGFALGACGAFAAFFASSFVNYNFGDAEVALLWWWMMGAIVVLNQDG